MEEAWNLGACAVGATIYFGHEQSREMIEQVAMAFERAHELGMATILWCYTRNNDFKVDGVDYHTSADLSSQAIHLGVTIQADIIKQNYLQTTVVIMLPDTVKRILKYTLISLQTTQLTLLVTKSLTVTMVVLV